MGCFLEVFFLPDGNPYARMAELMQGGDSAPGVKMYLGTVARRAPLEVIVAGTPQPAEALRRNAALNLEAGDAVLALTENDQIFYIICKVVGTV